MTVTEERRRPRRIAADEAHAWARHLRLHNSLAKLVLSFMTLYVNGDGICFVGIDQLAEDTELSPDTVRKRLAWLEQVGAIARLPQWIDASGRRNSEGRGKRTSDEIRLLLNADPDEIERRALGNDDADSGTISPRSQPGLNPDQETVSPLVAPDQPSDSGEGLTSEPEPEKIPPNPPSGGRPISEATEQRFQQFKAGYPDGIVDVEAAHREFCTLSDADQVACLAAVPVYADRCRRRREKSMKGHLFVRKHSWVGLLASPETAAAGPSQHPPNSAAGIALLTLGRIARYEPFRLPSGNILFQGEVTARLLALATAPPEIEWVTYERGSQHFAAWRGLITDVFAGCALRALNQISAPWPYPPLKDGSISTGPPGDQLSDQEAKEFTS